MQRYNCTHCHKEIETGGSVVHGGMFFKMCSECIEDEEILKELNEFWSKLEEGENDELTPEQAIDELVKQAQELDMGY